MNQAVFPTIPANRLASFGDVEAIPQCGLPVLDLTLLGALLGFLGPTLEVIYGDFIKECASSIDLLEMESAVGDLHRAAQIAHQMFGACSTLGMLRLAAAFAAVEGRQSIPLEWVMETRGLLVLTREAIDEVDFGAQAAGA